jgi:hypothetical protein
MSRRAAALLALFCLAALLLSVWRMGQRVAAFNASPGRQAWAFIPVNSRSFSYAGRPVRISDIADGGGREAVMIDYGDEHQLLPATIRPGPEQLPNLVRHQDWLKILRFTERGQRSMEEVQRLVESGQLQDRLVAVVRRPKAEDERTLGQGWRKQWAFDFHEFRPEGGFSRESFDYPSGRTIDKPKPGQLREGTWQFEAALFVMPPLGKPNPKFTADALHAMGWTLPTAAFSGLGLLGASLVLLIGKRRRDARD